MAGKRTVRNKKNVVIVTGICARNKSGFGIRFEEIGRGNWIADWAFSIRSETAKREGYDKSTISGSFRFSDQFPGCPHCKSGSFVKCECGSLVCHDGESSTFKCPACGISGAIGGDVTNMSAGHDR